MAQFPQRLRFDLANAFAGDGEMLADFFERVLACVQAKTESQPDDLLFAGAIAVSSSKPFEFKSGCSASSYALYTGQVLIQMANGGYKNLLY